MHNLMTFLLLTFMTSGLFAQNVQFVDEDFKNDLLANELVNLNGDDEIQISEAQAYTDLLDIANADIDDLTGIEEFVNLTRIYVSGTSVQHLDLSKNTKLKQILCPFNQIQTLNLGNSEALEFLLCDGNFGLDTFNLKHDFLDTLILRHNDVPLVDLSNLPALTFLDLNDNGLSSVDVTNNPKLIFFRCHINLIQEIDISNNPELEFFDCMWNSIKSIDLSNNPKLTNVNVSDNVLTKLDLSFNLKLEVLHMHYTDIKWLDLSLHTNFRHLNAFHSNLEKLFLDNGNNEIITAFDVRGNEELECIQVDNKEYSNTEWENISVNGYFSEDCNVIIATEDQERDLALKLFPNPVSDAFQLQFEGDVDLVEIINTIGQVIKTYNTVESNDLIDVKELNSGMYHVVFHSATEVYQTSFMKL